MLYPTELRGHTLSSILKAGTGARGGGAGYRPVVQRRAARAALAASVAT